MKWFTHNASPKLNSKLVSSAPTPITALPRTDLKARRMIEIRRTVVLLRLLLSSSSLGKDAAATVHFA